MTTKQLTETVYLKSQESALMMVELWTNEKITLEQASILEAKTAAAHCAALELLNRTRGEQAPIDERNISK